GDLVRAHPGEDLYASDLRADRSGGQTFVEPSGRRGTAEQIDDDAGVEDEAHADAPRPPACQRVASSSVRCRSGSRSSSRYSGVKYGAMPNAAAAAALNSASRASSSAGVSRYWLMAPRMRSDLVLPVAAARWARSRSCSSSREIWGRFPVDEPTSWR